MAGTLYIRGGLPAILNGTVAAASVVGEWHWRGRNKDDNGNDVYGTANHLKFQNTGTNPILLSFNQADADDGIGWFVNAGERVELDAEIARFFVASVLGSTFQAIILMRRGG